MALLGVPDCGAHDGALLQRDGYEDVTVVALYGDQ
jgi:hypothetical protein